MRRCYTHLLCLLLVLVVVVVLPARGGYGCRWGWEPLIWSPVDLEEEMENGTRWAVPLAGSNGHGNYRHQVKERTSNFDTYNSGSHVMDCATKDITPEKVYLHQGFDPETINLPANRIRINKKMDTVNQRDADLIFLWLRYMKSSGSNRAEIFKQMTQTLKHRGHLDSSVDMIGVLLFGPQKGHSILHSTRGDGLPLVDDWECLKSTARLFEKHCGLLTDYGMKHMRAFANICNNLVEKEAIEEACISTCSGKNIGPYAWTGTYSV